MINMNAQIIFIPLQKLIAITIVFHISYQCAIMSEITFNITLQGPNCDGKLQCSNRNRLRRHFIQIMIAYDKHQYASHCYN